MRKRKNHTMKKSLKSLTFTEAVQIFFCNACRQGTNHELVYRYSRIEDLSDEESGHETYTLNFETWKCRGCDAVTFRHHKINDFIADVSSDAGFHYDDEEKLYPRRARHIAKYFFDIPQKLRQIYNETVDCFNAENRLLCGAGIRATIEGICSSKGISGGNLKEKLDALSEFIPKGIVSNLHGLRFLGNDIVHELKVPKDEDLELALEIVEDMLNVLYNLDYRSKLLAEKYKGKSTLSKNVVETGNGTRVKAINVEAKGTGHDESNESPEAHES